MTKLKITKIAVFDFDGTLVNTPLPDEGKIIYQEKTGKAWPHEGWWGKRESLDIEIFEMPVNPDVKASYHAEKTQESTLMVMLTGRMNTKKVDMTTDVKTILDSHGFEFDEYILNRGGSTDVAKIKTMEHLLDKWTDVTFIEMWDDRLSHIPIFQAWGEAQLASGRLTHFKINVVETIHGGH